MKRGGHLPDPACALEANHAKHSRSIASICLRFSPNMLPAANQVKHTFGVDSLLCAAASLADLPTITTYLGASQFGVQRRSALLEFKPG